MQGGGENQDKIKDEKEEGKELKEIKKYHKKCMNLHDAKIWTLVVFSLLIKILHILIYWKFNTL